MPERPEPNEIPSLPPLPPPDPSTWRIVRADDDYWEVHDANGPLQGPRWTQGPRFKNPDDAKDAIAMAGISAFPAQLAASAAADGTHDGMRKAIDLMQEAAVEVCKARLAHALVKAMYEPMICHPVRRQMRLGALQEIADAMGLSLIVKDGICTGCGLLARAGGKLCGECQWAQSGASRDDVEPDEDDGEDEEHELDEE